MNLGPVAAREVPNHVVALLQRLMGVAQIINQFDPAKLIAGVDDVPITSCHVSS
jgi:hypothetical protein